VLPRLDQETKWEGAASPCVTALDRIEGWLAAEQSRCRPLHDGDHLVGVAGAAGECRYRWDARGDLIGIDEPDGRSVRYLYDAQRRLAAVHRSDGRVDRYRYDPDDRLVAIERDGCEQRFRYDAAGRLMEIGRGGAGAAVYRYDDAGQVIEERTAIVTSRRRFDPAGRVAALAQVIDGIEIALGLTYDDAGRLAALTLSGCDAAVGYRWDGRGRPAAVTLGDQTIAQFDYVDARRETVVTCGNGTVETSRADPIDARPLMRSWRRRATPLLARECTYDGEGRLVADGLATFGYDDEGRLARVTGDSLPAPLCYHYDGDGPRRPAAAQLRRDAASRLINKQTANVAFDYLYDDADQLTEVRRDGCTVATFTYDAKGRLAMLHRPGGSERYLYGPADELVAVTDAAGVPLRLYLRTPIACLAVVHFGAAQPKITWLHHDERGTVKLVSAADGSVARVDLDPFGLPLAASGTAAMFRDREWMPDIGLYRFGARWYDPEAGEFLTADTHTAAPDDIRIVHPLRRGRDQALARDALLGDWLKRPVLRHPFVFCGNDPVNSIDPNGHWSFGGVLLAVLGALWTLPNTVFGLLVEITCLIGEVLRWLVYAVTGGHVSWATLGFDVAASGRLNAFALVFSGGWLGSFASLRGITFGNVFFVYKDWRSLPEFAGGGSVSPPAHGGREIFPVSEALYEHELRHTNQYGWFGPFFHLGLPLFGVYEWDVILHGYQDALLERDARDHGGI
jgi:YD repeat-containing protein